MPSDPQAHFSIGMFVQNRSLIALHSVGLPPMPREDCGLLETGSLLQPQSEPFQIHGSTFPSMINADPNDSARTCAKKYNYGALCCWENFSLVLKIGFKLFGRDLNWSVRLGQQTCGKGELIDIRNLPQNARTRTPTPF